MLIVCVLSITALQDFTVLVSSKYYCIFIDNDYLSVNHLSMREQTTCLI